MGINSSGPDRVSGAGPRPQLGVLLALMFCLGQQLCCAAEVTAAKGLSWWSLQPVQRPAVPGGDLGKDNPIDRFLSVSRGVQPKPPADRLTLLRRVHLDLTGLSPTPEEQEAFLADLSPDAYQKVVDRLLADEQHAVRYARHWLDVLRYADADERMTAAPGIHLWRDWVIRALHEDLPYDQFVQVQLTGRRSNERTQMSATGHRSQREPRPGDVFALGFLSRGAGSDPQELAMNAVDTISSTFLGMTVACAKCHDHMFDPVSQANYYSMKALFDPLVLRKMTLASAADLMAAGKAQAELERQRAPLERERDTLLEPVRSKLYDDRVAMLPPEIQAVIRKPERTRSVEEQKIADDYFPILRIDGDKIDEVLTEDLRKKDRELRRRIDDLTQAIRRTNAPVLPVFHTVEADPDRAREQRYILTSADPSRSETNRPVNPGWPFVRGAIDFREGRVEAFADWLTSPDNPLFARVAVNRLWQWHFGEGLHRQPSDFGHQAGKPTQPELLDWLASEFARSGFSLRHIHRIIVTSATYQRASESEGALKPGSTEAANHQHDPDNRQLWRHPVRRLEAEAVWDSVHRAAGLLDVQVGGPSFEPGERSGASKSTPSAATATATAAATATKRRRGAYMTRGFSTSREATPEFLRTFDAEDGRDPCPMRTRTVTAPQALFLMNSPEVERAADALAGRLRSEAGNDLPRAVDLAYRLVLSRPPEAKERERSLTYLENDPQRLSRFAWLLFNLDEFIHVP
ncbi:MAG: DUF1549 and DUF1553 domain-containing protein [Verrucomicrobiota bacterium]|nr:DUF1549 and DUF1553 domain-containing protein [Verrucomicrobiota bacterium]